MSTMEPEASKASQSSPSERTPLTIITKIPYGTKSAERFSLFAADWRDQSKPLAILVPGMWQSLKERNIYSGVARALVEDGLTVAMVEYSPLGARWPRQLSDLQRAVPVICSEAKALGGDAERLLLVGDGLGAFLVDQLLVAQAEDVWLSPRTAGICGFIAVDGLWDEGSWPLLGSKHPLRRLITEARTWQELRLLPAEGLKLPPGFLVQVGPKGSEATERFAIQAKQRGSAITVHARYEGGTRIWRGISRKDHPLRVSWRPWLRSVTDIG